MTISQTRRKLTPLLCVNCNAPLIVVDAPSLVCPFCGASNVMPEVYREELRLTRDLDSATREAAQQWLRLAHIKVPRWRLVVAAIAPFVLMPGSLRDACLCGNSDHRTESETVASLTSAV